MSGSNHCCSSNPPLHPPTCSDAKRAPVKKPPPQTVYNQYTNLTTHLILPRSPLLLSTLFLPPLLIPKGEPSSVADIEGRAQLSPRSKARSFSGENLGISIRECLLLPKLLDLQQNYLYSLVRLDIH